MTQAGWIVQSGSRLTCSLRAQAERGRGARAFIKLICFAFMSLVLFLRGGLVLRLAHLELSRYCASSASGLQYKVAIGTVKQLQLPAAGCEKFPQVLT